VAVQRSPFWRYWAPAVFWNAAVLVLSGDWGSAAHSLGLVKWLLSWIPGLTPAQLEPLHFFLRKAAHVLAYGLLYFLWFRVWRGPRRQPLKQALPLALGLCLAVALLDEGHQALVGSRSGSWSDVLLDLSGATLAAVLVQALWKPAWLQAQGPSKNGRSA